MDAYGIAKYQEINPATFSIITFPFLFAVMFGDFGHGMVILIIGATVVTFERRLTPSACKGSYFFDNEIFAMVFSGRFALSIFLSS